MKKILFFLAAMLVALTANATSVTISPSSTEKDVNFRAEVNGSADTIFLNDGEYIIDDQVQLKRNLVVMAVAGAKPLLKPIYYCAWTNGAKLTFDGVIFDGTRSSQQAIRVYDNSAGKELRLYNCEFQKHAKDVIACDKDAYMMDTLIIDNCYFHNNDYCAVYCNKSSVADQNTIKCLKVMNSTFANNNPAKEYRALIDVQSYNREATDAIEVLVDHCTFYNNTVMNYDYSAIRTRIVNKTTVSNCIFVHPTEQEWYATNAWTGNVKNCLAYNFSKGYMAGPTLTEANTGDPKFKDAANGDFTLGEGSPALGAGSDGSNLGDPRWWPAPKVTMKGAWDSWADPVVFEVAADKKTASVTKHLEKGDYEFKMVINDAWLANGYTYHRDFTGADNITSNGDNMVLKADAAGDYKVTWTFATNAISFEFPELPVLYCEYPTGHMKDADFGDPNGRILLTIRKIKDSNDLLVVVQNNNLKGNPKTGLNYLWVNAEGATGGVVRYGDGSHTEADVEEVSVVVPFDAAKETYNFINIHWAYAGWDGEWAIDGLNVKASELCDALTLENGYYLVGKLNGVDAWDLSDLDASKMLVANAGNPGEYMLDYTFAQGDEIKVVKVRNDAFAKWYHPTLGNYVITDAMAGEATVYFNPDGNTSWGDYLYLTVIKKEPTSVDNVNSDVKAVKVIENGQLILIKNGVRYNAQGAVVK